MMMSQQFTPGIIGGFPIDAIRTDLNRLYYGDVRTESLGSAQPIFGQGLGWQGPVPGQTPWQVGTPWWNHLAGGTSQLPWAVMQGYSWPYQASYPVGTPYLHPMAQTVGYLPQPFHAQVPGVVTPSHLPVGSYLPLNGQTFSGSAFLPINGQIVPPMHDWRLVDPRFVADPRLADPRFVDPRYVADPRFVADFRPLEQRAWDLRFDPRYSVDPRYVDPRLVADPRFVADPRLAMIDPRGWMPSSTHLYSSLAPAVNTAETPDAHLLVIELPGVDVRDITLQVAGNQLILTAFRKPIWNNGTVTVGYHATEGRFGTLRRVFPLPPGYPSSQIQANFVNGQITIVLPKAAVPMGAGVPAANVAINAAIPATV